MFQESRELPVTAPARVGKYHELAEAIRRGCALRPVQCFGVLTHDYDQACAIGAAREGGFPRQNIFAFDDYILLMEVYDQITALNDRARWSREAIADWLDAL